MNSLKTLFLILSIMTLNAFSQAPPLEPGVSHALAKWRAANYSDVRYKLDITLEKQAPLMKGEIEIRVNINADGAKNDLVLDWRTTAFDNDKDKPSLDVVAVNESVIKTLPDSGNFAWMTAKEHLVITKRLLKTGENTIKIKFASPIKTSGSAVTRYVDKEDGAEYVYSLFVPSDASTAFPVLDQPDLKARFKLNVIAPEGWKVISNGFLDSTMHDTGDTRVGFSETQPISTYVFSFAAGNFEEVDCRTYKSCVSSPIVNDENKTGQRQSQQKLSSIWTKIFVRKSQAEKFKPHAAEVFRLNSEAVKYLESYFDYKFPFQKYDLVLIPEFPFGGMEHAGATFLREDRVIFPQEPTANDYITRGNLIFHEAAHQWFGDTVTMRWFDDLWLKEGFAEFMAYKTMERVLPQYNAWKAFYERNKPLAYLTDATRGTTPIYQEIPNLSAAKSAYGNIVYRKAPSFLRQAEFYLGADKFQTAVRRFLKKHEFANAEWTDLVKEFETASGQDLKDWAKEWVAGRGVTIFRPIIFGFGNGTKPDNRNFRILQQNSIGERSLLKEKTKVLIIQADKSTRETEFTHPNSVTGNFLLIKESDKFIFPNYQDYGYGIFLLDEKSRKYALENIQNEKDDFLHAMMWGTLWDSVREAELAPQDYVELAIKNIAAERDELTIQTILNRAGTAMNYYLSDAQARALAPRLEAVLIERIENAETVGQRIVFSRAFVNFASTERARAMLKGLLRDDMKIKGLTLKTKDRFDIAARLAVLGDREAARILDDLTRAEKADEAARYAYAARAGFGTAENKTKYFADFVGNKELSESWIEAAFAPFNSTRHADLTLPYLERALAELPNLKRNRKIFFVNGWLAAFIGGQKSEAALGIVNKFLADNPNLDRDLRLKILENVDGLERSVKIRAKYAK